MDVVRLEAPKDFRLEKLSGQPVWYVPADEDAEVALDNAWQRLTGTLSGEPMEIAAKGRVIRVPEAAKGVARFSFRQLCEQPLGASDYLRIAHEFHTLILEAIPVMDYPQRNAAKRFIALIDTLYDNAVKLVASAAAEPPALYLATKATRRTSSSAPPRACSRCARANIWRCRTGTTSAARPARPRESSKREFEVPRGPRLKSFAHFRFDAPASELLRRNDESVLAYQQALA